MTESEYFTSTSTPEIYSTTTLRYFNFNKRGLKEVMDVMIELGKTQNWFTHSLKRQMNSLVFAGYISSIFLFNPYFYVGDEASTNFFYVYRSSIKTSCVEENLFHYVIIFICLCVIILQLILIFYCGLKYLIPDMIWRRQRGRKIRVVSSYEHRDQN